MIYTQVVKTGQSKTQQHITSHVRLPGTSTLRFFLVLIILETLSLAEEGFINVSTED